MNALAVLFALIAFGFMAFAYPPIGAGMGFLFASLGAFIYWLEWLKDRQDR